MDQPVAIVTGAGRGIGRATAQELFSRSWRVALVARTASDLEQTAGSAAPGQRPLVIAVDVSNPGAAQHIVEATLQSFGRIDALVNNAGYAPAMKLQETSDGEWDKIVAVNVTAPLRLMRAVWGVFAKQGGGVIVNVSSQAGRDPFPVLAAYGAAKAALNVLTLAAAREGQGLNIRVHAVAPGATETGMLRSLFSTEQMGADQTMAAADVARVIVQCILGDLRYSSGEVIYIHRKL